MSYIDAQNILDMRRAGANMPVEVVNRALELTGDINPQYTITEAINELKGAV